MRQADRLDPRSALVPARVAAALAALAIAACGRLDFVESELAPPGQLAYPESVHAVLGVTLLSLTPGPPANTPPAAYTIEPALPQGLVLDASSGVISGVPSMATVRTRYKVTAASVPASGVSRSASFWLTVLPGYEVTSTVDGGDDDLGADVTCFSTAAGGCSLRAAVQTARNRGVPQLVLLGPGSYTLSAALPLLGDLVIAGESADTTIVRPTAIKAGYRMGNLTAESKIRLEDLAVQDFGVVDGGALRSEGGVLEAYACVFRNNEGRSSGGVLYATAASSSTFESCTFLNNRCTTDNGWGGVFDAAESGTRIVVRKSVASGNMAVWGAFSHLSGGTTLLLENSTLHGNTATRAGTLASPGGKYTLVNDTIVYNTNTFEDSAGLYLFSVPAQYTLTNTLVAFNTARSGKENNCNRNDTGTMLQTGGGNLFSDGAGNCSTYLTNGDLLQTDPKLDPLGPADHGGLTPTYALAPGSPALDAAVKVACPAEDQRGLSRPGGAACDIGAYEEQ